MTDLLAVVAEVDVVASEATALTELTDLTDPRVREEAVVASEVAVAEVVPALKVERHPLLLALLRSDLSQIQANEGSFF